MNPTLRLAPLAVITMLACSATPGVAQVAAPPAAPAAAPVATSPAKKELVKKALQLQQPGIEGIGVAMANQTAGQLLQIVTPAITRLPEDKRKTVATELQAEVRKFQGEVAPILRASATKWAPSTLGTALEEKLTEDELKTLVAWLESPVSRKYHQLSGDAQQALTQKIVAETRSQIEPKLKAVEQAMTAKLKAASAAPAPSAPKPADAAPKK
jgi:F0F1-type ATP synthase membrane subunit b/b'